jgi:NADH-quinone oxidoreductase subunit J
MLQGLHQLAALTSHTKGGETITFWILAPVMLGTAIAMIFMRSAVHSALMLVANFLCLAVFYAQEQAPFLSAVQVIVYTGAILVLFLFVIMLVGVDNNDSLMETIRGQRLAAGVVGIGFVALLVGVFGHAVAHTSAIGLDDVNANAGNVQAIAKLLFTDYFFPFEVISALLIVAAIGAMVLGHREREGKHMDQRAIVVERFAGSIPLPDLSVDPSVPVLTAPAPQAAAPVVESKPDVVEGGAECIRPTTCSWQPRSSRWGRLACSCAATRSWSSCASS